MYFCVSWKQFITPKIISWIYHCKMYIVECGNYSIWGNAAFNTRQLSSWISWNKRIWCLISLDDISCMNPAHFVSCNYLITWAALIKSVFLDNQRTVLFYDRPIHCVIFIAIWISTRWSRDKWTSFSRRHCQLHFLEYMLQLRIHLFSHPAIATPVF